MKPLKAVWITAMLCFLFVPVYYVIAQAPFVNNVIVEHTWEPTINTDIDTKGECTEEIVSWFHDTYGNIISKVYFDVALQRWKSIEKRQAYTEHYACVFIRHAWEMYGDLNMTRPKGIMINLDLSKVKP